jgi:peroxiredoxin Q/BCP
MLQVGDLAPDFVAPDHTGREVRSRDYRGKTVLIWFFPGADTPG